MKKIIIVLCIFIIPAASFAADSYFRIDTTMSFGLCLNSAHLVPEISASYHYGILGIGTGVKTVFGLNFNEIYLTPYLKGHLGWLYLGVGAAPAVKAPEPKTGYDYIIPDPPVFVMLGLSKGFIPIGPGNLGFNISLSAFPSYFELEDPDDVGQAIGNAFAGTLVAALTLLKVNAGIMYSIPLGQ
jgi:hypothetical protein